MDFAVRSVRARLSLREDLATQGRSLEPAVHPVPAAIDRQIARLKLRTMGVHIDALTDGQRQYLTNWKAGT